MASLNKVFLIGYVGNEPELFYVEGETPLAKFSLASHVKKKHEEEQKTDWHHVVAWGELAEITVKKIHKGDLVFVEGKIQYKSWDDKQGNTQREVNIFATIIKKFS